MKKQYFTGFVYTVLLLTILFLQTAKGQNIFPSTGAAGIGTVSPNASSLLEIKSTSQGILIPRMTKTKRDAIVSPAEGLLIYQNNSTPGFYYYNGSAWTSVSPNSANNTLSNLASPTAVNDNLLPMTDSSVNLGSADSSWKSLYLKGKIYIGGVPNIYVVSSNDFFAGPNAGSNLAYLYGQRNTGIGTNALLYGGYSNAAVGWDAMQTDSLGSYNAALGVLSLANNVSGNENAAAGNAAMYKNETGSYNTGIGSAALSGNISGNNNVAVGAYALYFSSYSQNNTGVGYYSLHSSTTGQNNTSLGYNAGSNIKTGSGNIFIGYNTNCGTGGAITNSTAIGNDVTITANNSFVLGSADITSWGFGVAAGTRAVKVGTTAANGNGAYLTAGGTWTNTSARSKKEDFQIQDINSILEKINRLEVTKWKYKGTGNEYHYGPMADDFHRLFSVGDDSSTSDMDKTGVLFLGMQQLIKLNNDKDSIIQQQDDKISTLESRLTNLEAIMHIQLPLSNIQQQTINVFPASLQQNAPNPFSNATTIHYTLPQNYSSAKIIITDKNGKILKEINVSGTGKGGLKFDAATLSSGAYQYSLYVNERLIDTKQMVLSK